MRWATLCHIEAWCSLQSIVWEADFVTADREHLCNAAVRAGDQHGHYVKESLRDKGPNRTIDDNVLDLDIDWCICRVGPTVANAVLTTCTCYTAVCRRPTCDAHGQNPDIRQNVSLGL